MESKIINQTRIDWMQLLMIVVTVSGLFFWSRSESRADCRRIEDSINANMIAIHEEMKEIHIEMKDFHGRLCAIEERKK